MTVLRHRGHPVLNDSAPGEAVVRQRSHLEAGIPPRVWNRAVRSGAMRRPVIMLIAAFSVVFATAAPRLGALGRAAPPAARTAAVAATPPPNLGLVSVKLVPFATGLDRPVAMAWRNGD